MTYKCRHCGHAVFLGHPSTWYHENAMQGVTCGHAEPDGLMPAPPNPAQELCNRWHERLETLIKHRATWTNAYGAGQIDEIDLFLADLRQTFQLPNDPNK